MEIFNLDKNLNLFSVTAESFPHDIGGAFHRLVNMLPDPAGRVFFGISYLTPECEIIYKAAVLESYEGEGKKLGCESLVVEKGKYISETIHDWKKDMGSIGATFRKLSGRPDTLFPCVEWYRDEDVICMVRLATEKDL